MSAGKSTGARSPGISDRKIDNQAVARRFFAGENSFAFGEKRALLRNNVARGGKGRCCNFTVT
jgi:hypothetical protein